MFLELWRVENDVLSLYNYSLSLDLHACSTGPLVLAGIFLAGIVTNCVLAACEDLIQPPKFSAQSSCCRSLLKIAPLMPHGNKEVCVIVTGYNTEDLNRSG